MPHGFRTSSTTSFHSSLLFSMAGNFCKLCCHYIWAENFQSQQGLCLVRYYVTGKEQLFLPTEYSNSASPASISLSVAQLKQIVCSLRVFDFLTIRSKLVRLSIQRCPRISILHIKIGVSNLVILANHRIRREGYSAATRGSSVSSLRIAWLGCRSKLDRKQVATVVEQLLDILHCIHGAGGGEVVWSEEPALLLWGCS